MADKSELYQIADELRAIASLGLRFADNNYDQERYEKVMAASARLVALIEERDPDEILEKFQDNLLHLSPLCGANAAVLRGGKLLLIQRADNKLWATPGGLVDVGETLAEAAVRELYEETGLQGTVERMLGVFDSRIWETMSKTHLFHFIFKVETGDQTPNIKQETINVGFFAEDELPPLAPGHRLWTPDLFELLRGEKPIPYFDVE
ncbi:MAG: NUDIX domain-containing protein [Chloroflexi bacterium]|nr:NUDIX domain-containing protein [Chloroflexota bacterium]